MNNYNTISDAVINAIKAVSPETLSSHGVIEKAKYGYICPNCGNGEGKSGTGIDPTYKGGVLLWHCFKCDASFDNIGLLAFHYHLSPQADFPEICRRAVEEFNIGGLEDSPAVEKKPVSSSKAEKRAADLIALDIAISQKNIHNLSDPERRGLTAETLDRFGVGFLAEWIHPLNKIAGKTKYPTRRLIIPTSSAHYVAVALLQDRAQMKKKYYKMHAGTKEPFGIDLLNGYLGDWHDILFVTEGEIDCMSIDQAAGVPVIAIGGAAETKWIETLDKIYENVKKPAVYILFDNDDAGKRNAEKLRELLIKRGYPAATVFFSIACKEGKTDANQILREYGERKLSELIHEMRQSAVSEIQAAESFLKQKAKKQPANKINPLLQGDLSDLDNARRIARFAADTVKFLPNEDRFVVYSETKGIWDFGGNGNNSSVYPVVYRLADEIADSEIGKCLKKQKRISAAVTLLKGVTSIFDERRNFDNQPMKLNVANGVIDLETGNFFPHSPKERFSKMCRAGFNPKADSSLFLEFMQQILPDEETRAAVLRFLGYCLSGSVMEEQALFVLGSGGNGKGTLFKTVSNLLGDYAIPFNIDSLLQRKLDCDGNAPTPEFAKLEGARLAIANEVPAGRQLDVAHFKDLTGGDAIAIRRLHCESSTIENPTHKLILCGQHTPDLADSKDVGLMRRLIVARFTENFTGEKCDPTLKYRLLEPAAQSGTLNVLLQECLKWQREGLIISAAMESERQNYLDSNDFISTFISDNCEFKDNASIARKAFLDRLKKEYPQAYRIGDRALCEMIQKVEGVTYKKMGRNKINSFCGISFLPTDEEEQPPF